MNEVESTGNSLIPTVGSADVGLTLDEIGSAFGLTLQGDVRDLAGVLNRDAAYDVQRLEAALGIPSDGDWGYYAKRVAGLPGRWLKAWVRWNEKQGLYDYSLSAEAGEVFEHATPYVGSIY